MLRLYHHMLCIPDMWFERMPHVLPAHCLPSQLHQVSHVWGSGPMAATITQDRCKLSPLSRPASQGVMSRIIPHRATGRADYFGPPVNRAARFLAASAPGQTVAEKGLVEECVAEWSAADKVRGPPHTVLVCVCRRHRMFAAGSNSHLHCSTQACSI